MVPAIPKESTTPVGVKFDPLIDTVFSLYLSFFLIFLDQYH
jgi:hypothetical protein